MPTVTYTEIKAYQPVVHFVSYPGQSDHFISVVPFWFDQEEDAIQFAVNRNLDRDLLQTISQKLFLGPDGRAAASIEGLLKADDKNVRVIHQGLSSLERSALEAEYDGKTARARSILRRALTANDTTLARERILRDLRKADIFPQCWRSHELKEPTKEDLRKQEQFMHDLDRTVARRRGKEYIPKEYTLEEVAQRHKDSPKSFLEEHQKQTLSVYFWDDSKHTEGIPGAKFASIGYPWSEDQVVMVEPFPAVA